MTGYRTVLWDLDGTLVGLRQRTFKVLMPLAAARAFRDLMPPHRFLRMLSGVLANVRANDTEHTNTDLMIRLLAERMGIEQSTAAQRLHRLAEVDFPRLHRCFAPQREAIDTVNLLQATGVAQVVATNPLWPLSTVTTRLRWGGYEPEIFAFHTNGGNMRSSKPRVEFYRELLERLGAEPGECVMIGNDAAKDAPAARIGIPVFLVGASESVVPSDCARTGLVRTGDWRRLRAWLDIEEESCSSS
ncbi:HAD family hydrolase [Nocardia sp. GCM10030253]|uniref:HAD family hydrolase n=1 Tax=Nocardia sp. GCM10030253 TaxID=3273404 RepID=UPI00363D252B